MSHHDLKHLTTRKSDLETEKRRLEKDLKRCKSQIGNVDKQIQDLTAKVVVSEHAILRYAERKIGINCDEIREKILSEETEELIKKFKSGRFPIGDGLRIVVKNNVVVSVVD